MFPVPDISAAPRRFKLPGSAARQHLPSLARRYLSLGGRNMPLPDAPAAAVAEVEAALFGLIDVAPPLRRWVSDPCGHVLYGQGERLFFSFELDGWVRMGLSFADDLRRTRPGVYRLLRELVRAVVAHTPCSAHCSSGVWMWEDDEWWREENPDAGIIETELKALDAFLDIPAPRDNAALRRWIRHCRRYRLPRLRLSKAERGWFTLGLRVLELRAGSSWPYASQADHEDLGGRDVYLDARLDVESVFNLSWFSLGPVGDIVDAHANDNFGNYGAPFLAFEIKQPRHLRQVREAVEFMSALIDFYVEGDGIWNK